MHKNGDCTPQKAAAGLEGADEKRRQLSILVGTRTQRDTHDEPEKEERPNVGMQSPIILVRHRRPREQLKGKRSQGVWGGGHRKEPKQSMLTGGAGWW